MFFCHENNYFCVFIYSLFIIFYIFYFIAFLIIKRVITEILVV